VAVRGYGASAYSVDLTYSPRCCASDGECNDDNPCTDDWCEAEVCSHADNTAACDDGDACTQDDVCSQGTCAGTALSCPEGQVCVDGACESAPDLTLYTSCVNDDLDPEDRSVMVEEMTGLGYTAIGENTNVSNSALNDLLARTDITTLYHTGHGFEGGIATANNSVLTYADVGTINVQNVILATCFTLTDDRWPNKMGTSSTNVLGYTKESYDGLDTTVVRALAGALAEGSSYIRAWYSANVAESLLNDRWCGYTREASGIVEYSARTGNVPMAYYSGPTEQVDADVWVASDLLTDSRTFADELAALQMYEYYVAGGAVHSVQFFRNAGEFLTKAPMTTDRAVKAATAWLGATLPSDASMDVASGVEATVGSGAPTTVAYRVRYVRVIDGLPVLTNGWAHHIEVVVDAGGVSASSELWPTLDVVQAASPPVLLGVDAALASAIDQIEMLVKQPVTIVDVMPCYGSTEAGQIVPAYAFLDSQGVRIVVDASTGYLVF
jgi:hypothetical protein